MSGKYDILFTSMKIAKTEIKNRIVMCAMGGSNFIRPDGTFSEETATYLIERAKGGTGLLIPGITVVQDMYGAGTWFHNNREAFVAPARHMMDRIHAYGAKMFIQLGAGMGRVLAINSGMFDKHGPYGHLKFNPDRAMVAPSDGLPNVWIPEKKHRALTRDEIHEIIDGFAKSAKMAQDANIDGIEIHAIHEGYLLDQFSVEATNHRTDEYGGSLENRLRFVCEVIRTIKRTCGEDYPVIVRYSVASKMKGFNSGALPAEPYKEFGRSLEESPRVAQILEEAGCDALNADNGSYDSWYWAHPPMYMPMACNLPEATYIKNFVHIPVFCAGRMEDPNTAAKAVSSGAIDGVGLARQLLADPEWPNKVQGEDLDDIRPCIACHNGCFGRLFQGKSLCCAINPAVLREDSYRILPAKVKKRIAVVGGGVGGMEVARLCAMRGHDVTLYEKTGELGGVFVAAAAPDFKEADKKLVRWYKKQIRDNKIDIRMNTEVTPEVLKKTAPQVVIVATGSKPKRLRVPGIDGDNVIEAVDFLLGKKQAGAKVVVVGGGLTGCEIAYDLAKKGKAVTLVEMLDDILKIPGLSAANSNMLRELLTYYKVEVLKSTRLREITATDVKVVSNGVDRTLATDTVVIAAGYDPCLEVAEKLKDCGEVHVIGDARHVGNLMAVVWDAYDLALKV